MPPLSLTPEVETALRAGAPIALGLSGGKDSTAMALAVNAYLDEIGHPRDNRLLVHADLGRIEWPETERFVRDLAQRIGLELLVVRRQAGDMLERWEGRWRNNVSRYVNLECVTLITPWSSASMRFCTSELKVDPICSALRKRWPEAKVIISATGIRAEESANRAKQPIAKPQAKLARKRAGGTGVDWHPILGWKLGDVMSIHEERGYPLHPAYTTFGSSRLSCAFCVLARKADHLAALANPGNHASFLRIAALEADSGFSFQSNAWLADRNPELLPESLREKLAKAKDGARRRQESEARIPDDLRFTAGWPTRLPTASEAEILAGVRREVAEATGLPVLYRTGADVLKRYVELMAARETRLAA